MIPKRQVWAVQEPNGHWYPCDHMLLDPQITKNSRNARPFFDASGKFYAELFARIRPGRKVVPHPHPEMWK